jgi:O-antigen/teichoic acid export membrane protein
LARLRQLASDTVLYGISTVVSRFLNYLLVPFYTAYFDPAAYGIVGLIYGAMIFLNVLVTFGMESAYLRYGAEKQSRKQVFQQIQLLVIVVSLALTLILLMSGNLIKPLLSLELDLFHLYEMMLGILVLDAISTVPFADLRLERKAFVFMVLRISNVVINVGLNLYLIIIKKWGLEAVLISNLVASALTTLAAFIITFKGFSVTFDKGFYKKIVSFGLPYIPAGIGYAVNEVLDRFLINAMNPNDIERIYGIGISAETLTGIYNASYKLGIFMMLFIQMFRMAWQPFYMSHHKEEQAKKTFTQSFSLISMIAGVLVLLIGLFREEIAAIPIPFLHSTLIDSRYWSGLSIVPFLLIAYWFQLWYTHFTAGIVLAEKTGILPKATLLGAAITLIANVILLPILGLNGAAIATLMSYMSMSLYMLYETERVYPINYPWISAFIQVFVVALLIINNVYIFVEMSLGLTLVLGLASVGIPLSTMFIQSKKYN